MIASAPVTMPIVAIAGLSVALGASITLAQDGTKKYFLG